jgi:GH18 family chitinase
MGSCQIASRPHCGKGSGTATKRRIAYYQSWNLRERKCDKVRPKDLNLKGLTHLYYAFLFFDPQTFQVKLMDDADEPLLREFTDLKKKGPETWIAVGGWSFSDEGATHHAFSDMVSSKQNRAAFITSLIAFMDKYGFQGADIDWEYPGDERRGGRKKDTLNLSLLIMEMRVRFNSHSPRLGLSMAIAPDYEYLRHFDVKAMEPLVDWFGFMGYDLAGAWDADNAAGRTMRAHTDITLVEKGMRPLDFAGVNPSKINLGMAYYGRSYRVPRSGAFCQTPGQCKFEDYGQAGECTSSKGVLSNKEIKRMISNPATKGRSFFNQTGMYKYITHYGDGLNVVAYDDADTFKMKMEYANDRCLGGTMIWSVDFDDQSGGDYGAKGGGDAAPNKPAPGGKITCYNRESQGLATPPRENWEDAINSFCDQVHGAWNDHRVDDREKFFDDQKTSRQTTITAEAEIQRGCTADVSIVSGLPLEIGNHVLTFLE